MPRTSPSRARLVSTASRRYRRLTDGLEFRILGPLEVVAGGSPLPLGGAKQRGVLALLLLSAGEAVSTDRIVDALWGGSPPESAANMVQGHVSQLRKAIEPGRARGEHKLLVSHPRGYVLRVARDRLDAERFERLAAEGRRLLEDGDARAAAERLRAALELWRGPALADLAYEQFARADIERLEEQRLTALEDRIDADLALGRHADVVGELHELVAEHPLRERFRGQLMTALYRGGRQAEALEVYRLGRSALRDELGIEPGPALRELERAVLEHDPELGAPSPAVRSLVSGPRRRRAVLMVAVAAAGGVATAVVLAIQGGARSPQLVPTADSAVLLAARSGRIVREATVPNAVKVRFGMGSLWTVSSDDVLTRIDPAAGKTLSTLGLGIEPSGLAVGRGWVWVTDENTRTLLQVDPALNVIAHRINLPPAGTEQTQDVLVAAGSLWVAHGGFNPGAWVERIDPATRRVVARISIRGGEATALAFAGGAVWVVSKPAGELREIDPSRNMVVRRVNVREGACCIAAGGGYLWVAVNPQGTLWKLDERGDPLGTVEVPGRVRSMAYGAGALWVTGGEAGTVVRIDPTTDARRTIRLGHDLTGIDVRNGLVAVGVRQSAQDVTGALKGQIVRVAVKDETLFWSGAPTDPALWASWDAHQLQFHYATCAKLFNYRDAEGEAGKKLVPELAARWPKVSDGGRTYTFTIRRGYRFSPPSNEPVTAEAVRHSIERVVSPTFPWFEPTASDILGAAAYHAGEARHVSGLSVHGDTLVLRLVKPKPDLPRVLGQSPYCVVPASTPVVASGIDAPIPSAGPYYLATHTDSVAALKRNPNYGGTRPQHLDAIVFYFSVSPAKAASRIAAGKLDYMLEYDPTLGPTTAAARSAGSRYRLTPDSTGSTKYLALNFARPLFADARRREAVEYGLDRRALAAVDSGRAASGLLSPRMPGLDAPARYPLHADVRRARRLLGGRRFHAVFATFDPGADARSAAFARTVASELAAIGIDVSVLPLTNDDWSNGGRGLKRKLARSDISWGGDGLNNGDPVPYLQSPLLPARDLEEALRIGALAYPARDAAAAALARHIEKESLFAVYEDGAIPELVSPRLGCIVHQPEYAGVDLAALCLKH